MGQPPQRRLDAAGNDRYAWKRLAGALAVRQRRPVRPQSDAPARRVGIVVAHLAVGGVVIDERIHVTGADGKEEARPAELPPGRARPPIGLAQHGDAKARRFQDAAKDGHGEAGVVDIGVARDKDRINAVPAARGHLRRRHRQGRRRMRLIPEGQRQARRSRIC